jgi:hypothetical protein
MLQLTAIVCSGVRFAALATQPKSAVEPLRSASTPSTQRVPHPVPSHRLHLCPLPSMPPLPRPLPRPHLLSLCPGPGHLLSHLLPSASPLPHLPRACCHCLAQPRPPTLDCLPLTSKESLMSIMLTAPTTGPHRSFGTPRSPPGPPSGPRTVSSSTLRTLSGKI